MAVAPLFLASMAVLKDRLRLGGASTDGALAMIDQAVEDARLLFYGRLGKARVDELKAVAYVEDPETDAELLRSLANSVEAKVVRRTLLRVLPTMFLDASADRLQVFNDEAAFSANRAQREELTRLDEEIEDGLAKLAGDEDLGEDGTVHAEAIGPEEEPDLPGASVWPSMRRASRRSGASGEG